MTIEIDSIKFREYTHDMIEIGRMDMAVQLGLVKDKISQRQSYIRFGRTRVDTWEHRKLIESIKEKGATSTRYYSLQKLTILDKSEKYEQHSNKTK